MPYTRKYTARVLVEPDTDLEQLRWLQREAFERLAAGASLKIVDYSERQVPIEDLPPSAAKPLKRPLADFECYEFVGVAEVDHEAVAAFARPADEAPSDA